jgi:hypothetical protein
MGDTERTDAADEESGDAPEQSPGQEHGTGTDAATPDAGAESEGAGADGESNLAAEEAVDPAAVEERYDFEDFGPRDMDEMSAAEWEAAFDPDSWVTGTELLDRVEQDLRARIDRREVFAVLEREVLDGEETVLAYSDEGYAVVRPDGSVEGRGTVLRDVKPTVALCSMPDYEVPEPVGDGTLPDPETVPEGSGELGNLVLQIVGAAQVLAGVVLFVAWIAYSLAVVAAVVAFFFVTFGVFLLVVVANARLSDRFRSEEFRERLRSTGLAEGERPAFVPGGDAAPAMEKDGTTTDAERDSPDGGDERA